MAAAQTGTDTISSYRTAGHKIPTATPWKMKILRRDFLRVNLKMHKQGDVCG